MEIKNIIQHTENIAEKVRKLSGRVNIIYNKNYFENINNALNNKKSIKLCNAIKFLCEEANKEIKEDIFIDSISPICTIAVNDLLKIQKIITKYSLLYHITKDERYRMFAYKQFTVFINHKFSWGIYRLEIGIIMQILAIAYDLLFDYLSDKEIKLIEEIILTKIELVPTYWKKDQSHYNTNHNTVICCGFVMVALVIAYKYPDKSINLLTEALNDLNGSLVELEPDGAWQESEHYGKWVSECIFYILFSLRNAFDTDFGLSKYEPIKKLQNFLVCMEGPIGTFSINMSCHFNPRTYSILPFHYYYADLYNEPMFAFARNKVINSSSYNIWDIYLGNKYFDNIIDENEIKLPFDSYFRGFETVLFRNSWFEKDSIFVGMHGGKQDIAHGTLDAGQFQIQAMEQDWAISLGGENYHVKGWWEHYSVPYEGDEEEIIGRFSYYRARAEGRNCLIFNPDKRTEQCPKAITSFVNTKFNKSESFAVLDLYNAYYRDVECYKRGLRFDKINEIIYLNDEFKVKSKSEVLWIMHTKGDIEMSNDCQKVICTLNGKKMYLEVNTKNVQGKFETLKGEEPLCTSPKVDISYEPYHKRESDRKKLIYRANCEGECYINIAFYFKENKRSNIKCIELW